MRVMLMWPSGEPEIKILFDELERAGHEIAYWVGEHAATHLTPKGCIFHDHYDAWDAKRAEAFRSAHIEPAYARLIASVYETESLILTMMNKRYDASPVDERKHIYYTMLAYWNYVLERTKPDVIIYNTVPHSIYSNIVYDLAKKRDIRTLCFEETWVAGRLMFYRDFWHGSDEMREALKAARERGVELSDLHAELREYYQHQKHPETVKTPWYVQKQRSVATGAGLWAHRLRIAFRAPHLVLARAFRLLVRSFRADLRSEYEVVVKEADFLRPYVYFPLNFQPERTTSPQGGIFHDQILAAETLAAALPEGWELYVKEHPSQWWLRGKTRFSSARYPGYYARLAKIPHVRLVPIHTDTFTLTDNGKIVATITGTAGWEALLRGKHVLVFGIPWYRDCPGVLKVQNVDDCKKAFVHIGKNHNVPEREIFSFLQAFGETTTRAHLGPSGGALPEISSDQSMRAIASRLIREFSND